MEENTSGKTPQATGSANRQAAYIQAVSLEPGLYLVATPIGTARDITLRALDVLNSADLLAAEDTRVLRHLMDIHGIPLRGRRIISYHDHNADRQRPEIMRALRDGGSVAYSSDAGTPLVADPGYRLASSAVAENLRIHAVPGPSAVLAALSMSGLPSDRFLFAGFPPTAKNARKNWLQIWAATDATVVLFESPRRVNQTVQMLAEIEAGRVIVIARELTKKFEEVIRGTAAELAANPRIDSLKGEVVLMLDRPAPVVAGMDQLMTVLEERMTKMSVKDAAREVALELGLPKREVYQTALSLADVKKQGGDK